MKKCFALILALTLLLAPAALAEAEIIEPGVEIIGGYVIVEGEDAPADPSGEWYGEINGFPMQLTLGEDGLYFLASSAVPGEAQQGTWEFSDGYVWLDENTAAPLNLTKEFRVSDDDPEAEPEQKEVLVWTAANVTFRRETMPLYTPAEVDAEAALESMAGYWKSRYVSFGGTPVPAALLNDDTDIYIDGETVALGGELFGDVFIDFVFEDGALSVEIDDDFAISIALQKDGLLRMTLAQEGGDMTLYLAPAVPALDN